MHRFIRIQNGGYDGIFEYNTETVDKHKSLRCAFDYGLQVPLFIEYLDGIDFDLFRHYTYNFWISEFIKYRYNDMWLDSDDYNSYVLLGFTREKAEELAASLSGNIIADHYNAYCIAMDYVSVLGTPSDSVSQQFDFTSAETKRVAFKKRSIDCTFTPYNVKESALCLTKIVSEHTYPNHQVWHHGTDAGSAELIINQGIMPNGACQDFSTENRRGFYVASSLKFALERAKQKVKKVGASAHGAILMYQVSQEKLSTMGDHIDFDTYSNEWDDCVTACRDPTKQQDHPYEDAQSIRGLVWSRNRCYPANMQIAVLEGGNDHIAYFNQNLKHVIILNT
jgi:hypothetical protein